MIKVVIIGGGFAGVECAIRLSKNVQFDVIVVDKKDYFEITYAQFAALIEPEHIGKKSRFHYTSFLKAKFIQNALKSVSIDTVTFEDNSFIGYDILVIAAGSSYDSFQIGKPKEQLSLNERNSFFASENAKLTCADRIIIIGGGPAGVELAGVIAVKHTDKKIMLIHGKSRLLDFLSEKAGRLAESQLKGIGVEVVLNERVTFLNNAQYKATATETVYEADLFYNCTGSKANTDFMSFNYPGSLDEHGLIIVDNSFRVKNAANIYAIGDCNNIAEPKLGYLASIHGSLAANNIINSISIKNVKPYKKRKTLAIVPIGRDKGVIQLPCGVFSNKYVIRMKTKDFFISRYTKLFGVNTGTQ